MDAQTIIRRRPMMSTPKELWSCNCHLQRVTKALGRLSVFLLPSPLSECCGLGKKLVTPYCSVELQPTYGILGRGGTVKNLMRGVILVLI